jgi:hypothetical protein
MDATLKLSNNVLAYADTTISSNPSKRYVDWSRNTTVAVKNPKQESFLMAPGASLTVFDGTVTTSLGNATEFNLTISTLSSDRYRFKWSGVGPNPAFRTDRALTPNGHTFTWVVNINQTVSLTSSTAGEFSAVAVGDTLFVPGVSTGDTAGPFNTLNEGFWTVIGKDGTSTVLQLSRPDDVDFSAFSQVIVSTANTNLAAYTAAGVQVGNSVNISNGFSVPVLKTYVIDRVTPTWFEVISTAALPIAQTGVPTTTGMVFYNQAKVYLKIEADQQSVVRVNGDSTDNNWISPWSPADPTLVAEFSKTGPTWSLVVVNKTTSSLNLFVISAE